MEALRELEHIVAVKRLRDEGLTVLPLSSGIVKDHFKPVCDASIGT